MGDENVTSEEGITMDLEHAIVITTVVVYYLMAYAYIIATKLTDDGNLWRKE